MITQCPSLRNRIGNLIIYLLYNTLIQNNINTKCKHNPKISSSGILTDSIKTST